MPAFQVNKSTQTAFESSALVAEPALNRVKAQQARGQLRKVGSEARGT